MPPVPADECRDVPAQKTRHAPSLQQAKVHFETDPFDLLIQIIRLEEGVYQLLVTSVSADKSKTPNAQPEVLINVDVHAAVPAQAARIEESCYPLPFR